VATDSEWWPPSSLPWRATALLLCLATSSLFLLITLLGVLDVAAWGVYCPGGEGLLLLSELFYAGAAARCGMVWREVEVRASRPLVRDALFLTLGSLAAVAWCLAWRSLRWQLSSAERENEYQFYYVVVNLCVLLAHELVSLWFALFATRRDTPDKE
jgi:hypothetical protein